MKIDKPASPPVDFQKLSQQRKAGLRSSSPTLEPQQAQPARGDVDRVLKNVVAEIEKSGLSAGDIHSSVDEAKVNGFLQSMEAQSKRPAMSETDLLALADKTVKAQRADPVAAAAAFNPLDPQRIADLV